MNRVLSVPGPKEMGTSPRLDRVRLGLKLVPNLRERGRSHRLETFMYLDLPGVPRRAVTAVLSCGERQIP